jgi:hypothetical protein
VILKHSGTVPYHLEFGWWVRYHIVFCCSIWQGLDPRPSATVPQDEEVAPSPTEEGNTLIRGSQLETRITHESDPSADQDTLESIEPEYFSREGFDPCGHELKVNMLGLL